MRDLSRGHLLLFALLFLTLFAALFAGVIQIHKRNVRHAAAQTRMARQIAPAS